MAKEKQAGALEQAQARIAELEALAAMQEQALSESFEKLTEYESTIAQVAKGGRPIYNGPKEFEHEGKTYPFPAPRFVMEGRGLVTAEQALEDPTILAELVAMKAGKIE